MAFHECVLVWDFNSNEFNTVLHYDDGGSGPPDYQLLTDQLFANIVATTLAPWVNDLSLEAARWREDIPGGVGNTYFPAGGPIPGNAGSAEAVAQVGLLIRKIGVGTVRPVRGRIYAPGVPGGSIEASGLISAAYSNSMETVFESILTISDGQGATVQMVIKASNPTAPNTQPYTLVDGLQAIGNPVIQRKRRLGSGV